MVVVDRARQAVAHHRLPRPGGHRPRLPPLASAASGWVTDAPLAQDAAGAYQVDRYDARHLCLEAGVAYLVVVGEDGACQCPFLVRRQERVGRLAGTTGLPPSRDKTHQLPNPREHLFPRLARSGRQSHRKSGRRRLATGGRLRPW